MLRRTLALVGLAGAALALTACSASASVGTTPTVAKADVEKQITTQLTAQVGKAPDSVTCPSDLTAEVGATLVCTLTSAGSTDNVNVKVTSVTGGTAKFDIEVVAASASPSSS